MPLFYIISIIVNLVTGRKLKNGTDAARAYRLRAINIFVAILTVLSSVYMLVLFGRNPFDDSIVRMMLLTAVLGAVTVPLVLWHVRNINRLTETVRAAERQRPPVEPAQPEAQQASAAPAAAPEAPDKKRDVAFYLAVATSPVLFILRMATQEHAWTIGYLHSDEMVVPDSVKAIMAVLLLCSVVFSAYLRSASRSEDRSKATATTIWSIVDVIAGLLCMFV